MNILAIETATPASSVAIGTEDELLAMSMQVDRRGHVAFLAAAVDFCFVQAGWSPSDLDVVVVDVGPGLFTGIRAGLATAQGIAAATGARLAATSSLDALAYRAATGHRMIYPVVDVRRHQIAVASYRPVPGGVVKETMPEVCSPDELRGQLQAFPDEILVVGDWQALPRGTLRGMHRTKTGRPRYPSADVLLELAGSIVARDEFPDPDDIRPLYLREPDARINWQDFREEAAWPQP
jgi:tRNA threonylcarbamoyladenosine biosynthesis protein TsaB